MGVKDLIGESLMENAEASFCSSSSSSSRRSMTYLKHKRTEGKNDVSLQTVPYFFMHRYVIVDHFQVQYF